MPSYVTSMDGKINKINHGVLTNIGKNTIVESSHGFILIKDNENKITITVDEENITAKPIKANLILNIMRQEDKLLLYGYKYERIVCYNGTVYRYKGSVSLYEAFFVDSRLTGRKRIETRLYYKQYRTIVLRFCQNMLIELINRITPPLDILSCVDCITALSNVPI